MDEPAIRVGSRFLQAAGIEGDGLVQICQGSLQVSLGPSQIPPAVVGGGEFAVKGNGPAEIRLRLFEFTLFRARPSPVVVGFGPGFDAALAQDLAGRLVPRPLVIAGNGPIIVGDGCFQVALGSAGQPSPAVGLGARRIQVDGPVIVGDGCLQIAGRLAGIAPIVVGCCVLLIQTDRL